MSDFAHCSKATIMKSIEYTNDSDEYERNVLVCLPRPRSIMARRGALLLLLTSQAFMGQAFLPARTFSMMTGARNQVRGSGRAGEVRMSSSSWALIFDCDGVILEVRAGPLDVL